MTIAGWIFMLTSWALIIGLFGYCMARTLKSDRHKPDDM